MDPGVSFVPAEFWGVKVAPKKSVTVGRTFSANEDELDTYHLSQVRNIGWAPRSSALPQICR